MPTYSLKCKRNGCNIIFEKYMSIKDDNLPCCDICGYETERLIDGGSGIIFKGSGFYSTDYRSNDYSEKKALEK